MSNPKAHTSAFVAMVSEHWLHPIPVPHIRPLFRPLASPALGHLLRSLFEEAGLQDGVLTRFGSLVIRRDPAPKHGTQFVCGMPFCELHTNIDDPWMVAAVSSAG